MITDIKQMSRKEIRNHIILTKEILREIAPEMGTEQVIRAYIAISDLIPQLDIYDIIDNEGKIVDETTGLLVF